MKILAILFGVVAVFSVLGVPLALFADEEGCGHSDFANKFWIIAVVVCLVGAATANCCCQSALDGHSGFVAYSVFIMKTFLITIPLSIGQMQCNPELPIALLIGFFSRLVDIGCECQCSVDGNDNDRKDKEDEVEIGNMTTEDEVEIGNMATEDSS